MKSEKLEGIKADAAKTEKGGQMSIRWNCGMMNEKK